MSVLSWSVQDAPLVVVDVETTGFNPQFDRICEVAITSIPTSPEGEPETLLDTLVNPQQPVKITRVHGIEDTDVVGAPTFAQIAGLIVESFAGVVVVAHNAYFDLRFLELEFARLGVSFQVPYLCTMSLPPQAGIGERLGLTKACSHHGIRHVERHQALSDAAATARLMSLYRRLLLGKGVGSFESLRSLGLFKFASSWRLAPLAKELARRLPEPVRLTPRQQRRDDVVPALHPEDYTCAVIDVIADYIVTDDELETVANLRQMIGLSEEQLRAAHATVFSWAIQSVAADAWVDDRECQHLALVRECLQKLGWAPGDPVASTRPLRMSTENLDSAIGRSI